MFPLVAFVIVNVNAPYESNDKGGVRKPAHKNSHHTGESGPHNSTNTACQHGRAQVIKVTPYSLAPDGRSIVNLSDLSNKDAQAAGGQV
jgi:hypothetical protein